MKKFTPVLLGAAISGLLAASSANAWMNNITVTPFASGDAAKTMTIRVKSYGDPAFGGQAWSMHGRWGTFNAVKGTPVTIEVVTGAPKDASGNIVKDASGNDLPVGSIHPAVTVWKRPIGTVAQPYSYYNGPKNVYQKDASGNFLKDASGNKVPANLVKLTNLSTADYVPDHDFDPTASYIETGKSQNHNQGTSGAGCTDGAVPCATMTKTIDGTSVTAKVASFWAQARRATSPGEGTTVLAEDGTTDIGFPRMLHVRSVFDADGVDTKYWNPLHRDPLLALQKDLTPGKVTLTFTPNESTQYEFFVGGLNPDSRIAGNTVFQPAQVTVSGGIQ
jgi:hypothetical protein